jgi:hypothetical protein
MTDRNTHHRERLSIIWLGMVVCMCAAQTPEIQQQVENQLNDLKAEAEAIKLPTDVYKDFSYVEDDAPIRGGMDGEQGRHEHGAYNYTLAHSMRFSNESLARQSIKTIPFATYFKEQRANFQFELARLEGRLVRIREMPATRFLQETEKIEKLYEGWLEINLGASMRSEVACIVFYELPEGLKPAERIENIRVRFDGYFFKLMRYDSAKASPTDPERSVVRRAPLFLGRSPEISQKFDPNAMKANDSQTMLVLIFGAVLVLILGMLALSFWYQRTDRVAKEKFRQLSLVEASFENLPTKTPEVGTAWTEINDR